MQTQLKLITLLLADDHLVAREGIRSLLAQTPDIQIVAEAEDGDAIQDLIRELHPDVLLLDLKMPGTSSFEIEKWVRENYPETVTLVFTAHDRDSFLAEMIDAGVAGYMDKNSSAESIITAIRRAAQGEVYFTTEQIDRAKRWRQEVGQKWERLTEREREVLSLVTKGLSNKEIAKHLGITIKTVAYHVSGIFNKLDVESRCEAIAWYQKHFPENLE